MRYFSKTFPILFLTLFLLGALPQPTDGCAVAPPPGLRVDVAEESAIIIWDAAKKTQHFIRHASFQTEAKDFGFLVPTPSQPTLAEADDSAFYALERITAPKIVYEKRTKFVFELPIPKGEAMTAAKSEGMNPKPADPIHVLEERTVAGYDAAVLQAEDAKALATWLEKHGYSTRPDLAEWLKPYIEGNWTLTAFKVSKDGQKASTAVQMSFKTEKPFFPYREPADQRQVGGDSKRLLRVYFLSDTRYAGKLGATGSWPGATVWADKPGEALNALRETLKLKAETLPFDAWLTEFEDRASPRPGTDEVYFSPATEPSVVQRPPVVIYTDEKVNVFWLVVLAGVLLVTFFLVKRMRGARS